MLKTKKEDNMRDIIVQVFIALIATAVTGVVTYVITLIVSSQVILITVISVLIGIGGFVIWHYHRRRKQEREERATLGIEDIYPFFSEAPSPDKILNSATSHFEFLGTSGRSFFVIQSDLYKLLEQKLREGIVMRFLLLDPLSPNLQRRAESENYSPEAMKRDINNSIERIEQLKAQYPGKIDYATYTSYPIWRCIFIDDREAYVSYYPPGSFGDKSPSMKLVAKPSTEGFYRAFRTYFEEKWRECQNQRQKKKKSR